MKTAVSIPDLIFEEAEKLAEKQGISRSELYATALQKYLKQKESEEISRKLNEVYAKEDSSLDPVMKAHVARMAKRSEW